MFKNISLLFFALLTFSAFSQNAQPKEVSISGIILDQTTQTPLEYATVIFTSKNDTKTVTGGITNELGVFNIEVNSGNYAISIEYIGYKTKNLGDKLILRDENYGTLFLEENAEALEEVEIIAEKTTVEIKLDKKIYNVGKDLTVRGGTVSDVLDNVPSVSVDVEGNVSLRGNDNVRILINGKPSGLVGLNSTEALRQLPAESIEKVEVITSPSARYDAEGTGGILNIILRRSKLQGLNGAMTVNTGFPNALGLSGNINYRTGDLNIFNTTGSGYREIPGNTSSNTRFNDGLQFNEETIFERFHRGVNTNFGVEWYINDSASLTTSVFYRLNNHNNESTNTSLSIANDGTQTNTLRFDPETEDGNTIQYAVNYTKNFKTSGHKLTFDFQFEDNNEDEISSVFVNGINSEKVATLEDQQRILLQTDYVLPIGEKSQFEIGYRGNFNTQNTDYTVEFLNTNTNVFEESSDLTNLFNYKEYLTAFYSQFGSKFGKFSFLIGLRMENTQLTLNQPTTGDFNKKNYTGLFPTVNANYELSESENLTLAFNRRLRRPRSYFINPFPSRASVTSVFQGNPDLDPSYSGTFDLGYIKRFGKFTLDASTYYSHATDVFNFVSFDTGETVLVNGQEVSVINRTPINLATEDRYGFEFTLGYKPSRKWNINANFNVFERKTEGVTPNGLDLGNTNSSWFARINNKYTLPGKIDWQTRLVYRGPSADAQNERDGIFSANLAFSKDLFKEKASLALNVSDLLNSRKRSQTTTTPTFVADSEFQWRERSFNLSFTYRFNQKKKQQRQGGFQDGGDGFEG